MWTLPPDQASFDATPKPDIFAPSGGWQTVIVPGEVKSAPWIKQEVAEASYKTDENLKKKFGIELAKAANPFEAACVILEDTSQAYWISVNWLADAIVIASRDTYLKTVALSSAPLDKEQLAAKVLALADEKILLNGVMRPTIEAKDRIAALKLYSDILGYTGKVEIDASNKTFTHNEITLKLVKAEPKVVAKPTIINQAPNVKSENVNEHSSPVTLKLVGGASR